MVNFLNRKKQLAALVTALATFAALAKWASPEVVQGGVGILLAVVALVSRDDAPPEQTKGEP